MAKQNNRRIPLSLGEIMIRAAAVLFCLVLITTSMMAGLFARYTAKGSAEDSARVAAFNVLFRGLEAPVTVDCKDGEKDGTYTLTVENKSEVAVSNALSIVLDAELDDRLSMKLSKTDSAAYPFSAPEEKNGKYVYTCAIDDMAPQTTQSYTLTFTIIDWTWVTETVEGKLSASKELEFTVVVDSVQID